MSGSYTGIDLCDQQGVFCAIEQAGARAACCSTNDRWYPTVVMPIHANEPPLFGPQYANHRRGQGFAWPPECQIPYQNDLQLGLPRFPLTQAWWKLNPYQNDASSWDQYDSTTAAAKLCWKQSRDDSGVSMTPEQAVAGSAQAGLNQYELQPKQAALVVPDDLGEGAQQALLDAWRKQSNLPLHLVPRPVAAAMYWCEKQHAEVLADANTIPEKGLLCGHVAVLNLGMDRWEFSCLGIRIREHQGIRTLVPVRDHTMMASALPATGLKWLMALHQLERPDRADLSWHDLFCSRWFHEYAEEFHYVKEEDLEKCLSGAAQRLTQWFGADYDAGNDELSLFKIRELIDQKYAERKKTYGGGRGSRLLGVIVSGQMADLPINGHALATYLTDNFEVKRPAVGLGNACADGAAHIAMQLALKLPTYYDRLAPIDIYTNKRDEYLDWILHPVNLIPNDVVEAGITYEGPKISGFEIQQNQQTIKFEFRRKTSRDVYRGMTATIRQKCENNEPVYIVASAQPGQGQATAYIHSEEGGAVNERLDWNALEEIEKPKQTELAWPPRMATVQFDAGYFNQAYYEFRQLCSSIEQKRSLGAIERSAACCIEKIHLWKKLKSDEPIGMIIPEDRMFTYFGPVPSNSHSLPEPLKDLTRIVVPWLTQNRTKVRCSRQLKLFCSWLYAYCPEEIIVDAIADSRRSTEQGSLALLGNCTLQNRDIAQVISNFVAAIKNDTVNNNWLRTYRNLVRFRVYTVSTELVSDAGQYCILDYITRLIKESTNPNSAIMINCLRCLPQILKRRKFDPDFLDPSGKKAAHVIQVLTDVKERLRLSNWKAEYIDVTEKFIMRTATTDDIRAIFNGDD